MVAVTATRRQPIDRLAATLSVAGTRRALLQLLPLAGVLGAFGTFGLSDTAAKKKGKKKGKKKNACPPCRKRKRGKCKDAKPDGTACTGGTCQGGSCVSASLSPLDACANCTGDQVCVGGACVVPACGAGGPCRVFASSILYDGDLGGLSGADAKCQGLAAAAGLPGAYKAWLADNTSSPISRFVPSTGPYRLVNGATIAANWADLTDGNLIVPISVTETGGSVSPLIGAWTNTRVDGARDGAFDHCVNWSSNAAVGGNDGGIGRADRTNSTWTDHITQNCSAPFRLYCFQQS
jgi:hypothetical protein